MSIKITIKEEQQSKLVQRQLYKENNNIGTQMQKFARNTQNREHLDNKEKKTFI